MSKYQSTVDIARALNLSPSTVSRALNDHYSISAKTKQRVLDYAREVGFQKNLYASRLNHRKTFTVGILMPEISSHTFSTITSGIKEVLEPEGYDLILMHSAEQYEKEVHLINYLTSIRADGIIYSPTKETNDYAHLETILKNKIPFVNIDRGLTDFRCHQILLNDKQGAYLATQHLFDMGCRSIAHLAGPKDASNARHRIEGYQSALNANGLPFDPALITHSDFRITNSNDAIRYLLERDPLPDGIFVVNDEMALGCMHLASEKGLDIPHQLAIIGFDDEVYSQYFRPSLSTVRSPVQEMGRRAARVCLQQIENYEAYPADTQLLTPQLIVRASSRRTTPKHYA
ncbi:MAG: LacI family DNA-binding transcriptional regulator [Cyclobacteriaceae bacterium]